MGIVRGITGRPITVAMVAGAALAVGLLLSRVLPSPASRVGDVLLWISLGLGGVAGLPAAWAAIRSLRPDIDLLMVVGAALSAAIGHPEEGALLLFMFTLAGGLEQRALARARDAVSRLQRLMPRAARRQTAEGWEDVDPEALSADDIVLVRPGETVPADAVVTQGRSHLDQSRVTGESMPRPVAPGDSIYAGTTNADGAIEARVLRGVRESSIQRILALVLEAQERRQPVQRVIDRVSTPYAATVMLVAVAIVPLLALTAGLSWMEAVYRAITLLVVCSPCALVIATPTATLCGLSRAARAGVLIKGGDALERLAGVRTVALDKTGTLTAGRMDVVSVRPVSGGAPDELLGAAAAAEERSTHPIAAGLVRHADARRLPRPELRSVRNVAGRGVEAESQDGPLRVGTLAFCEALLTPDATAKATAIVDEIRHRAGLPVVVATSRACLVVALADQPRTGARELVRDLHDAGVSRVVMLTGDHRQTATQVAQELGIAEFEAELLPEQKVAQLERLRGASGHGGLAVVGDGVNDAPALASADVGIGMGSIGSDATLETADVVLLNDDLGLVPWVIGLARRARRLMAANLVFALGVIVVLATFTIIGAVPLTLGVVGHEGSTLLVVASSLTLLRYRARRRTAAHADASPPPMPVPGAPVAHHAVEPSRAAVTASDGASAASR